MATLIDERVELARNGKNPTVVCRVPSGWVVLGDSQFLTGYCLLLPDPVVSSINDLNDEHRILFLRDMVRVGDALLRTTKAYRINYEILGNTDPALHAHIFPRYMIEPEELRAGPAWFYNRKDMPKFDAHTHASLMKQLKQEIEDSLTNC